METELFEPASGRLFICIELPDYVRAKIETLQRTYRKADGLHWIPGENLHVTLAFLGEVESEETQRELAKRLTEIQVRPFFLEFGGIGIFPGKGRPRVLWSGVEKADPRLFQLHGKVAQVGLDLGFEPELRRYSPHVTIARCEPRGEGMVHRIAKVEAEFGTAPFQVAGFSLCTSQLTAAGRLYTSLLTVPLE